MSKIVSTRLNDEEIELLNEMAQMEHLDRSTLLHQIIIGKIIEIRMKKMADLYRKGTLSLQEAATGAKVSLYEMMEYVEKEGIVPHEPSMEEMESNFKTAQSILKQSRVSKK